MTTTTRPLTCPCCPGANTYSAACTVDGYTLAGFRCAGCGRWLRTTGVRPYEDMTKPRYRKVPAVMREEALA